MSVTFAAAALQLSRRGALAQQLNAIESLASVDLICLDKTGTLTEPGLRVVSLEPAAGVEPERLRDGPGALRRQLAEQERDAASRSPATATLGRRSRRRPCRSRRRGAGARCGSATSGYVLGAPELFPLGDARRRRRAGAARGPARGRVRHDERLAASELDGLEPLGVAVLAEELRPQARDTVRFFHDEGVELKVMSGDAPETVGAIARDAGIEGDGRGGRRAARAARPRERGRPDLTRGQEGASSRRCGIAAATWRWSGDGVNDVPALKASRLAIAQGSGSEMARSVADVVLVQRRLRGRARDGRPGPEDPPQPPAGHEALRGQVGVRGLPDPLDRADRRALPAAAAPPHARGDAHGRHPRVLPGAGAQLRAPGGPRASCARSAASPFRPGRSPGSACSRRTCSL